MKTKLLLTLIEIFMKFLSEDNLKKFADGVLDLIENKIEASTNKWDDAVILPLCATIRKTFDIPDND